MADIHVLCLVKENERYVYIFSEDRRADVLRTFARQACSRELSFGWYDAAVMSKRVRESVECAGK